MAILTNAQPEVTATNTVTLTNKTLTAPTISDPTFTGTTTNINTTNLVVEDKNIVINDVTSPTDVNADGGGISLNGDTTKTLNWVDATDAWTSSENLNLLTTKTYKIAGTDVLTATQVLGKSVPSGTIVGTDDSQTLTNKTIDGASNTITNIAISTAVSGLGSNVATFLATPSSANLISAVTDETGTGALVFGTSPTLTTPVISSITNTGTLTLPTTTGTLALTSDITVTESSTNTLSNKTLTAPKFADLGFIADANGNELIILDTVASAVNEVTLANAATLGTPTLTASGTDTDISLDLVPKGTGTIKAGGVDVVTTTGTQTLTNKTLTSPTINTATIAGGTLDEVILNAPQERTTVTATAAGSTVNFDVKTQGVLYFTTDSTGNWTLNVRGDGSTTLDSLMTTGDALTIVFLATNGATPYYSTAFQVDGNAITPKFQNGVAFAAGSASAIDIYSYTIFKTASATFTVLAGQTKFA
jgi:hypothetical protein